MKTPEPRMKMHEVAARAKVSTATVSRVINRSPLVQPKTAQKVWQVIRDLGYYPDTQARALVSGKTRMFGLIIPDIANPFFPELVKAFEFAAIQHGYEAIIANTNYDPERTRACVGRMVERRVDGVAIFASDIDQRLLDELSRRRQPVVLMDAGAAKQLASVIHVDYNRGIEEAVEHLTSLGHERIAFIAGPSSLHSAEIRRKAFLKCFPSNGGRHEPPIIVEGNNSIDGGQKAVISLFSGPRRPTAVLASNDLTAVGALGAVALLGLRVPADLSVIGYEDIELSRFTQPPLTTVRLSRDELGQKAFEALHRMVENSELSGERIEVTTTLVVRGSTGSVRGQLLGGT